MIPELALYLGAWSEHFSTDAKNETHNLIGLHVDALTVAHCTNSYGRSSLVVAIDLTNIEFSDNFRVKFVVGAANGYRDEEQAASTDWRPTLGPVLQYDVTRNVGVDLAITFSEAAVAFRLMW